MRKKYYKLTVALQKQELYRLYYNRLHITILRNGIEFRADVRDRSIWMQEMAKWHETTIMVEEDVTDELINKMIKLMWKFKWTSAQINGFLYTLTNKRFNVKEGQMMLTEGVLA